MAMPMPPKKNANTMAGNRVPDSTIEYIAHKKKHPKVKDFCLPSNGRILCDKQATAINPAAFDIQINDTIE